MNSRILDLDDPSTYSGVFDQVLYGKDVWSVLDNYANDSQGKIGELFCDPKDINDPFLKNVQADCEILFRERYDYVVGYHACRTTDPDQYHRLGLLTTTRERMEAKVRELFAEKEGLEEAISKERSYFDAYEGQVHMYISAKFAATEYLDRGSMYIRRVAGNVGGDLEKQGKPVFVQCKLPLSWLQFSAPFWGEHRFLYRYVAALMKICIWTKAFSDDKYGLCETLAIGKDIPPENVISIVNATACTNWGESNRF